MRTRIFTLARKLIADNGATTFFLYLNVSVPSVPAPAPPDLIWLIVMEAERNEIGKKQMNFSIHDREGMPVVTRVGAVEVVPTMDGKWGILSFSFSLESWTIQQTGEYNAHLHLDKVLVTSGRFQVEAGPVHEYMTF